MPDVIEVKNLKKMYGRSRGIIDVSFNVSQGEIFGFIGPNGAGKSTTIRTLLALIFPTSGNANIFGKDCIRFSHEIAQNVGYLPSEVFYYDNMRVIELLKYSAAFYKKDCIKRIKELADLLELDLSRKIDDLSYGNKKKVGLVQGLLHQPQLIIMDEPTSGLDPLMQKTFFELVRSENKRGATILFSSHVLSEVQKLCSRVAIIKDGRIIKTDQISALQSDNYKKFRLAVPNGVPAGFFEGAEVTNLQAHDSAVSFLFKGDMNGIIKKLSQLDLSDLSIEEPTLEEIFMHYYT